MNLREQPFWNFRWKSFLATMWLDYLTLYIKILNKRWFSYRGSVILIPSLASNWLRTSWYPTLRWKTSSTTSYRRTSGLTTTDLTRVTVIAENPKSPCPNAPKRLRNSPLSGGFSSDYLNRLWFGPAACILIERPPSAVFNPEIWKFLRLFIFFLSFCLFGTSLPLSVLFIPRCFHKKPFGAYFIPMQSCCHFELGLEF